MIMATPRIAPSKDRCVHIAKATGKRCRKWPLHGQTECLSHGGGAPNKRRGAHERLLEMQHPALAELWKILTKGDTGDADRLRAIREVLDRTGLAAEQILRLEPVTPDPWQTAMDAFLSELSDPSGEVLRELPGELDEDEPDDDDLPTARSRKGGNGQRPVSGGGTFAQEWSGAQTRSAPGMKDRREGPKRGRRTPPQPPTKARRIAR
jgi:hypothetical protein